MMRRFACLLLVLLAIDGWSAEHVITVLSSDAVAYQQAGASISTTLGEADVTTLPLDRLGSEPIAASCVIAVGRAAAMALHARLAGTTPLVYCLVTDPDGAGLTLDPVASGVSASVPLVDQFALMQQAVPGCRTIGVLHLADDTAVIQAVQAALPAGWRCKAVAITGADRLNDNLAEVVDGVDVVWTHPDSAIFTTGTVRSLLLTALRRRVPVFGFSSSFVRAGALVGVGIDPTDQGRQAGELARGLLAQLTQGEVPDPVRLVPTYRVAINLAVAQLLDLELSDALRERAQERYGEP